MTEPQSTPLPADWQAYFSSLERDIDALKSKTSWWSLDTRASLAAAIVGLMITSIGMLVMLSLLNVKVDPTIFAVLTTLLGVLAGSFKDVYGFWYGNSSGQTDKDKTISTMVSNAAPVAIPLVAPAAPLQTLTTPLATTTGEQVTSVSGTVAPEAPEFPKKP